MLHNCPRNKSITNNKKHCIALLLESTLSKAKHLSHISRGPNFLDLAKLVKSVTHKDF